MSDERGAASMDEWPDDLNDEALRISEELLPVAQRAFEMGEEEAILMHPAVQAAFADEETQRNIREFELRFGGNRPDQCEED